MAGSRSVPTAELDRCKPSAWFSGGGFSIRNARNMMILTLDERKRRKVEGRRLASGICLAEMSKHARKYGGRYVVFGSFVTGNFRHDSDLDVLIDFPRDAKADPWTFLEDLSRQHGIPIDMHDASYCKEAFVDRVVAEGMPIE